MSLNDAQHLVSRMKEDSAFRNRLKSEPDGRSQKRFLRESGYDFDERELLIAMAGCMEAMEQTGSG